MRRAPARRRLARSRGSTFVQYGALPYRLSKAGAVELLLVTSRETKRWIVPKGWPIEGLEPYDVAVREGYEEAGIRGVIGKKAIGTYSYEKTDRIHGRTISCRVTVFPLLVRRQRRTWPERHQRKTKWVSIRRAASLIADQSLARPDR